MEPKKANYKGVSIEQNPLTGAWFVFFKKGGKFEQFSPYLGTLAQMKSIVDYAIRKGEGAEKELKQYEE